MNIDLKKIVKTAAKVTYYIISRAAGFGLFGLILNIILLVFLYPEMRAVFDRISPLRAGGSGAMAAAVLLLIAVCWPVTLMILGFGIAVPVVYFILGQKHGVSMGIRYIARENKEFIMDYTVDRLAAGIKKAAGGADAAVTRAKIINLLPAFLKKLDTMPRPLRLVFRELIKKIDLGGVITAVMKEQTGGADVEIDFDYIAHAARDRLSGVLEEKKLSADLKWFLLLAGVNIAVFAILKIAI